METLLNLSSSLFQLLLPITRESIDYRLNLCACLEQATAYSHLSNFPCTSHPTMQQNDSVSLCSTKVFSITNLPCCSTSIVFTCTFCPTVSLLATTAVSQLVLPAPFFPSRCEPELLAPRLSTCGPRFLKQQHDACTTLISSGLPCRRLLHAAPKWSADSIHVNQRSPAFLSVVPCVPSRLYPWPWSFSGSTVVERHVDLSVVQLEHQLMWRHLRRGKCVPSGTNENNRGHSVATELPSHHASIHFTTQSQFMRLTNWPWTLPWSLKASRTSLQTEKRSELDRQPCPKHVTKWVVGHSCHSD